MGSQRISYNQTFTLDYTGSFDPLYPKTGVLSYTWTCMSNFLGCYNLGKINIFDPNNRIQLSKLALDF